MARDTFLIESIGRVAWDWSRSLGANAPTAGFRTPQALEKGVLRHSWIPVSPANERISKHGIYEGDSYPQIDNTIISSNLEFI